MKAARQKSRSATLLKLAVAVLVTGAMIELGAMLVSRASGLPLSPAQPLRTALAATTFWSGDLRSFGEWHPPNRTLHHQSACFDVNYATNSYGARDRERERTVAEKRVLMLGDSFIEGWGVDRQARMSDHLEAETGLAHLNLGSSGEFGSTVEMFLYRDLGRTLSHDAVIIGVLPENDFDDNDLEFGHRFHEDRYRPYLVGASPEYETVFYNEAVREHPRTFRSLRHAKAFVRTVSFTYRLAAYLREVRSYEDQRGGESAPDLPFSRYYQYSEDALDMLAYGIEQIVSLAEGRPVLVVLIATQRDLMRFALGEPPPLTEDLGAVIDEAGASLLDLLPTFADHPDPESLYLPCDGHWTPAGHDVATRAVLESGFYDHLIEAPSP